MQRKLIRSILRFTGGLMRFLVPIYLTLLLGFTVLTAQTISTPAVQFEQTEYNFKNVKADSVLKYVFAFTNTGTDTLKILKVNPG